MGRISELANKMNKLNFEAMCIQTVLENQKQAAELNTQQLFQGERADGSEMPPYSWVSVNFYNKPAGPIRLFDTGAFYSGFIFANATFPLSITSTDSKTNELTGRYGKEIFGLTEENLSGYSKVFILPAVAKKLKDYMGL